MKTLSHILLHVFCLHFLRTHHDSFFRGGFEGVRAQFLSRNIAKSSVTCIRSNLPVAQNRRFAINKPSIFRSCHHGCQNFGFWALWKPENVLSRNVYSPKLFLENWISHYLFWENFFECPPNITIGFSIIVCLIPQHFSWFKTLYLNLSSKADDEDGG